MAQSSHWKPSTWEQFRKGRERSHLSSLLVFYWLPYIQSSISSPWEWEEEGMFSGTVVLLLSWWVLLGHLRKSRGLDTSSPWLPRSEALIWFYRERHPVQTQPRTMYLNWYSPEKGCFLAVIQNLNIHQICSCAAMCLFICNSWKDLYFDCVPIGFKLPVLYPLNLSVFAMKTKPASNFCGCVQFWRTAVRFTECSGPPALCLSNWDGYSAFV